MGLSQVTGQRLGRVQGKDWVGLEPEIWEGNGPGPQPGSGQRLGRDMSLGRDKYIGTGSRSSRIYGRVGD